MSKKFRNNLILCIMIFALTGTFFICHRQKKLLKESNKNLYMMTSSKIKTSKKENCDIKYEKIISEIKENSCIKIKKAINNNNKIFSMSLEFAGTLEELDKFINCIKKSNDSYEMESIKLNTDDNKFYKGFIVLNITI